MSKGRGRGKKLLSPWKELTGDQTLASGKYNLRSSNSGRRVSFNSKHELVVKEVNFPAGLVVKASQNSINSASDNLKGVSLTYTKMASQDSADNQSQELSLRISGSPGLTEVDLSQQFSHSSMMPNQSESPLFLSQGDGSLASNQSQNENIVSADESLENDVTVLEKMSAPMAKIKTNNNDHESERSRALTEIPVAAEVPEDEKCDVEDDQHEGEVTLSSPDKLDSSPSLLSRLGAVVSTAAALTFGTRKSKSALMAGLKPIQEDANASLTHEGLHRREEGWLPSHQPRSLGLEKNIDSDASIEGAGSNANISSASTIDMVGEGDTDLNQGSREGEGYKRDIQLDEKVSESCLSRDQEDKIDVFEDASEGEPEHESSLIVISDGDSILSDEVDSAMGASIPADSADDIRSEEVRDEVGRILEEVVGEKVSQQENENELATVDDENIGIDLSPDVASTTMDCGNTGIDLSPNAASTPISEHLSFGVTTPVLFGMEQSPPLTSMRLVAERLSEWQVSRFMDQVSSLESAMGDQLQRSKEDIDKKIDGLNSVLDKKLTGFQESITMLIANQNRPVMEEVQMLREAGAERDRKLDELQGLSVQVEDVTNRISVVENKCGGGVDELKKLISKEQAVFEKKMLKEQAELEKKLLKFQKNAEEIKEKHNELVHVPIRMNNISTECSQLVGKVAEDLSAINNELSGKLSHLQADKKVKEKEIEELKRKVRDMEGRENPTFSAAAKSLNNVRFSTEHIERNIIIQGVKEERDEDLVDFALQLARHIQVPLQRADILNVARLKRQGSTNKFPPIKLALASYATKSRMLSNKRKMGSFKRAKKAIMEEEEPVDIRHRKGEMRAIMRFNKENNFSTPIVDGRIKIQGVDYSIDELQLIPRSYLPPRLAREYGLADITVPKSASPDIVKPASGGADRSKILEEDALEGGASWADYEEEQLRKRKANEKENNSGNGFHYNSNGGKLRTYEKSSFNSIGGETDSPRPIPEVSQEVENGRGASVDAAGGVVVSKASEGEIRQPAGAPQERGGEWTEVKRGEMRKEKRETDSNWRSNRNRNQKSLARRRSASKSPHRDWVFRDERTHNFRALSNGARRRSPAISSIKPSDIAPRNSSNRRSRKDGHEVNSTSGLKDIKGGADGNGQGAYFNRSKQENQDASRSQVQRPRVNPSKDPLRLRVTKAGIIFSGERAFLSNFYYSDITEEVIEDNPNTYICVEQAFAHLKALYAEDDDAAADILNANNSKDIKNRSNGITMADPSEWNSKRDGFLEHFTRLKFRNEDLAARLIETYPLDLVEGTSSNLWGGGQPFYSKCYEEGNYPGDNRFGRLLERVREEIIEERGLDKSKLVPQKYLDMRNGKAANAKPPFFLKKK